MTLTGSASDNLVSGVDVDHRTFKWTIKNFSVIEKDPELIKSQAIDFSVGDNLGQRCVLTVYLTVTEANAIDIFVKSKEKSVTSEKFFVEFTWAIKTDRGKIFTCGQSEDLKQVPNGIGYELLDADERDKVPLVENNLTIYVSFKMYYPSKPTLEFKPIETMLKEFHVNSTEKARRDIESSLQDLDDYVDIQTITSKDGKEFQVTKSFLPARSPVFAAMLRTDMVEANTATIELPDISSKALEILLIFICTGELKLEWTQSQVIVELTNAAAKYQLRDLLEFLDLVLGQVCTLENVGVLLILAHQLSLKTAEEALVAFMKRKGISISTPDNLLEVLKGVSSQESGSNGEGSGQEQWNCRIRSSLSS